jgi:hypothetical protein
VNKSHKAANPFYFGCKMSIEGCLKQVSMKTLALLKRNPLLTSAFLDAKWLPESPTWGNSIFWSGKGAELAKQGARLRFGRLPTDHSQWIENYDWQDLERQFLGEWQIPELNLDEYWKPLTYLLAGYSPGEGSIWMVPALKDYQTIENRDFLPFLIATEAHSDSRPLINAFGGGTELDYETGYGSVRYLLADEVLLILEGLGRLSRQGFQVRCELDAKESRGSWVIPWSDDQLVQGLMDSYEKLINYYQQAATNRNGLLIYLT